MSNEAENREVSEAPILADRIPARRKSSYPRVTVRLTGKMGEAIEDIMKHTSAQNPSEAVRRAVIAFHTLVEHKLEGNEPYIETEHDGQKKRLPLFL